MKKPIPFGKYYLLERINVGGMAEVFKAKAFGVEGFERLVAVKRILPSIAEDEEFITMFIDEAKIAVQLTHPNIAQIFDLGKVGDAYFIALEYVHGKDMRAIFDRARKKGEPLPIPMACYQVMKMCEGLDYAHNKRDGSGRELNLVHRDVSPQNILVSYDGDVKLIDFGIAKAAGKAGKTQAGILKGKFGYMSPEQVRGLPLDRRSDIFSVGIVMYELLTGERLFVGESDFSTLEKVRNVEIMPPSTYNRRIPEELEQIVLKALAKDVDDRYQTAMDLHDDLQSFMYTSGNFFARKDLAGYMRKVFSDEIQREQSRDEEYQKLDPRRDEPGLPPREDSVVENVSDLEVFDDLPAAEPARSSPAMRSSVPPPPPPSASVSAQPAGAGGRAPIKSTMLGMPAVRLPPPPGGASNPPVAPRPAPAAAAPAPPPAAAPAARAQVREESSPALDMDWDDEELSTTVYDRVEGPSGSYGLPPTLGGGAAAQPPAAPPPAALPPTAAMAATPMASGPMFAGPPLAGPPQAPAPYAGLSFGSNPGLPATPHPGLGSPSMPSMPGAYGAPSAMAPAPVASARSSLSDPFATDLPMPSPARPRPAKKSSSILLPLLGLGLVVFIASSVGAAFYYLSRRPGSIELVTTPPDAVLHLDGEPVSGMRSPFLIQNVKPGPHMLEVRRVGFAEWRQMVEVPAGETLQLPPVTLERAPGSTEPIAAANGTNPLDAPVGVPTTGPPGTIGATQPIPGVSPATTLPGVGVIPGTTVPVAPAAPARMPISFISTPTGAQVILLRGNVETPTERRPIGVTPLIYELEQTPGDPWTIEMTLSGFQQHREPLQIPANVATHRVQVTLTPAAVADATPARERDRDTRERATGRDRTERRTGGGGGGGGSPTPSGPNGTLQVNAVPWAQVYVDGSLVGNTPQMGISLRPGPHTVTLVNPEFNFRRSFRVNIEPGQTVRRVVRITEPEQ
ncbi:MAG: protein kinase [Deltaproteobacteria bacterium]|nr:protein kinase [Deltaproteobacteria bacterium]